MNGSAPPDAPKPTAPAPASVKPSPAGPAPPAPAPAPPSAPATSTTHTAASGQQAAVPPPVRTTNGTKPKKRGEPSPVDAAAMYESLRSRIAALEEEEVHEEEEERRFAEEAQAAVTGMTESAVHAKYIELFAELKRLERDHAKEKQKLTRDKDAAKGQLTKANATKTKMEALARELQKDNKRLREDTKRLAQSVEDAQEEIRQLKAEVSKKLQRSRAQDARARDGTDVVLKVVCRHRAELFFRIGRKTKLTRLFAAWADRMDAGLGGKGRAAADAPAVSAAPDGAGAPAARGGMQFVFTHSGRVVEADTSPEEAGIEDGDEILAVELMDLTDLVTGGEEADVYTEPRRQKLRKEWVDDPEEAKRTLEELFNGVTRERLKDVLRQYELRERHFECVVRSKELEVLLSRARAAEQKQLAEVEKLRGDKLEEEVQRQTLLIDKLISCCKEPSSEKTQQLLTSLRDELEKRGIADDDASGAGGGGT